MRSVAFHFSCKAIPNRQINVLSFRGREEVDGCFSFDISLATAARDFDPQALVGAKAGLEIQAGKDAVRKNGRIDAVHVERVSDNRAFFNVTMVPTLQRLQLAHNFRTFVALNLKDALSQVLQACGLDASSYEFRLSSPPPALPFLAQYDESDLAFFKRRLEHAGWSFFFEFSDNDDKVVITDRLGLREDVSGKAAKLALPFAPGGSMQGEHEAGVQLLAHKLCVVPKKVRFKDWNYEHPTLKLEAGSEVQAVGFGEAYLFGDAARTPDTLKHQADLYRQGLEAQADRVAGTSTSPLLLPAQEFRLQNHPLEKRNTSYIPLFIEHWGVAAKQEQTGRDPSKPTGYHNRFSAIRADQAYRPSRCTPTPKVSAGAHAFIETEKNAYAQLDEQGRYHVRLGYDAASRTPCKASAPVRLMSPHAGPGYGLHFPLLAGAEVLVGHEQGAPDRPFILGVLPNANAVGPVSHKSATQANLESAGGNKLKFQDKAGACGAVLFSPVAAAGISLGAPPATLLDASEATDYESCANPPSGAPSSESKELLAAFSADNAKKSSEKKPPEPAGSSKPKESSGPPKSLTGNYFGKDGFNMWTAPGGWLSITAQHSSKLTLGMSYSCYMGLSLNIVAGVIAPSVETVCGKNVGIFIGGKAETNSIKIHNTLGEKVVNGAKTKIRGLCQSLRDSLKSARASHNFEILDIEDIIREQTEIKEEDTRSEGDVNKIERKSDELIDDVADLHGDKDEVIENTKSLINSRQDIEDTHNSMGDSDDELSESEEEEVESRNVIVGAENDASENDDEILIEITEIAGENVK